MSSAVEQLAQNANWGAFAKATELKQRILFVLGALLVYRLGTYIPVPGIDPTVWKERPKRWRYPRHVQHVLWWCVIAYDDLRLEHYALYLGIYHYAASIRDVAEP